MPHTRGVKTNRESCRIDGMQAEELLTYMRTHGTNGSGNRDFFCLVVFWEVVFSMFVWCECLEYVGGKNSVRLELFTTCFVWYETAWEKPRVSAEKYDRNGLGF